jgi:hypothetical protein
MPSNKITLIYMLKLLLPRYDRLDCGFVSDYFVGTKLDAILEEKQWSYVFIKEYSI